MGNCIQPLHVYTMKYTNTITFTFPNVPTLGNSLIYVWSLMGGSEALPGTEGSVGIFYNDGSDIVHDLSIGPLLNSLFAPSSDTGGNGVSTPIYWTQCVQATFNTVTIGGSLDNAGSGPLVTSYLTIYEVEGLIGQNSGVPSATNFSPSFDWKPDHTAAQGIETTADATLIALGEHMVINPGNEDCSCPPPATCGANDRQAKFTLNADFATVIANCAIPAFDFFNLVDPCDPAYVSNDFIFAVCGTGSADALTLTDNIQGAWVIDYQIDGQIFGHAVTPAAPGTGNIVVVKNTFPATAALQSFDFTPSWGSAFSLRDGQSNNSGSISTGTYSITETTLAGWSSSVVVSSGDPASAINLADGQTVTVTFTNTPALPTLSTAAKVYPWVS